MTIKYPVSSPSITPKEIEYVTRAVSSGWVSSLGSYIESFEKKFALYCNTKFALTTSNGTVALHLALLALDVKEGDEVIIPNLTFVATSNAVRYVGAKPVFVDIEKESYCIDPEKIREAINPKTKAIIPVHLYGHPANMNEIRDIAVKHKIFLIEDAAEATGAEINGKRIGGLSDIATHSFYGNKIITCGEGGMITTNSEEIYNKVKLLRDHAMSPTKRYWHEEVGYNYRMTNMQAALGLAQLERIEEILSKRRKIYDWYLRELSSLDCIRLNPEVKNTRNVIWLVTIELIGKNEIFRDSIMSKLKKHGIDTRPFFYLMSELPMNESADTPNAKQIQSSSFNLPTYNEMTEKDVIFISKKLKEILADQKLY